MYAVPDVDEVVAVAKELGIHLGPDEAVKYRKYLMEQMGELDTFVQARMEETKPPMVSADRNPGYRPSPEEDPLNAWMWKCRIEGSDEGLLAGKTVSYKAHAVANGYFVGAINRVGHEQPWDIGEFFGKSYFCDPKGKILAQGSRDRDEVVVADLDLDEISEVRATWQFFRDRRPETYGGLTAP